MGIIQVTEAARRLGVHRQTIENWGARGVLVIKKLGKAHYVDEDVIAKLGDLAQDVEQARDALERIREQYQKERQELGLLRRSVKQEAKDMNDERRYLNLCVSGGLRSEFFKTVITIMERYGSLKLREGEILRRRLEGQDIDEICETYGLTRTRINQIIVKAIRKSKDIEWLDSELKAMWELEADKRALEMKVNELQEKLKVQDEAERYVSQKSLEEMRQRIADNDDMCKLLNTKLVDCNLSVRTLNCMKGVYQRSYDTIQEIETVGDLCKYKRIDILKMRHLGKKTLTELDDMIESMGLSWGMDVDKIYKERVDYLMAVGQGGRKDE